MIWANAKNGVIGKDNEMPWHLPEDLKHFREITTGKPVVMGRRTWESLPEKFRPLPGRDNFVVSTDSEYPAEGALVHTSLESVLEAVSGTTMVGTGERDPLDVDIWVLGGGMLYRAAMRHADVLAVTEIDESYSGADTYAPAIGSEWELQSEPEFLSAKNGLRYRFLTYLRSS